MCSESAFGKDIENDWRSYSDAVSGLGFVENTVTWFPELKFVKRHMEDGAKMSLKQAMTTYEQNLKLVETRCQVSVAAAKMELLWRLILCAWRRSSKQ